MTWLYIDVSQRSYPKNHLQGSRKFYDSARRVVHALGNSMGCFVGCFVGDAVGRLVDILHIKELR